MYLQEVLFNDHAVWSDDGGRLAKAEMRSLLPEPGLPWVHIPADDYRMFASQFMAQNLRHPDFTLFECSGMRLTGSSFTSSALAAASQ